jgi:GntR family transcriptional regulator, transcriptional repressor for pyruvate dehydrogenase complex
MHLPHDLNRRKPVYERLRQQIRELIRAGELQTGQKLPSERELAERFKTSRNSVREAIRLLVESKVVESRHGDGTYVGLSTVLGPLTSSPHQSRRLRESFEFRRLLEPQIAALAARNITQAELDAMKLLIFEQEKRIISGVDDTDLDTRFHLALAKATKNSIIIEVINKLSDLLQENRSEWVQSEARRTASLRTHVLIIDALERRDPKAVEEAMNRHLLEVEEAVFTNEVID